MQNKIVLKNCRPAPKLSMGLEPTTSDICDQPLSIRPQGPVSEVNSQLKWMS